MSPPIRKQPTVFPQYMAGRVPQRVSYRNIALLLSLPVGFSIVNRHYQAVSSGGSEAASAPFPHFSLPDSEELSARAGRWFANLMFGPDDRMLTTLTLAPLSFWFLRTRFLHSSTPAVRALVAVFFPLFLTYHNSPVFFKNLTGLHSCEFISKLESVSPNDFPLVLRLSHSIDQYVKYQREHYQEFPHFKEMMSDPKYGKDVPAFHKTLVFFFNSMKVLLYLPYAVFSYHWVQGGKDKYADEYRAFLLGLQNLKKKPSQ
jgi:hypothetical protein